MQILTILYFFSQIDCSTFSDDSAVSKALSLVNDLSDLQLEPSRITYNCLINILVIAAVKKFSSINALDFSVVWATIEKMINSNDKSVHPDSYTLSTVVLKGEYLISSEF